MPQWWLLKTRKVDSPGDPKKFVKLFLRRLKSKNSLNLRGAPNTESTIYVNTDSCSKYQVGSSLLYTKACPIKYADIDIFIDVRGKHLFQDNKAIQESGILNGKVSLREEENYSLIATPMLENFKDLYLLSLKDKVPFIQSRRGIAYGHTWDPKKIKLEYFLNLIQSEYIGIDDYIGSFDFPFLRRAKDLQTNKMIYHKSYSPELKINFLDFFGELIKFFKICQAADIIHNPTHVLILRIFRLVKYLNKLPLEVELEEKDVSKALTMFTMGFGPVSSDYWQDIRYLSEELYKRNSSAGLVMKRYCNFFSTFFKEKDYSF